MTDLYTSNYPSSGYGSESVIRTEFDKIEEAFNKVVPKVPGATAPQLTTDLDMNGNEIIGAKIKMSGTTQYIDDYLDSKVGLIQSLLDTTTEKSSEAAASSYAAEQSANIASGHSESARVAATVALDKATEAGQAATAAQLAAFTANETLTQLESSTAIVIDELTTLSEDTDSAAASAASSEAIALTYKDLSFQYKEDAQTAKTLAESHRLASDNSAASAANSATSSQQHSINSATSAAESEAYSSLAYDRSVETAADLASVNAAISANETAMNQAVSTVESAVYVGTSNQFVNPTVLSNSAVSSFVIPLDGNGLRLSGHFAINLGVGGYHPLVIQYTTSVQTGVLYTDGGGDYLSIYTYKVEYVGGEPVITCYRVQYNELLQAVDKSVFDMQKIRHYQHGPV